MHYRLTTRKPKDLLIAWIYHLIANTERATESFLITAKDDKPVLEEFAPVEKKAAMDHLWRLLQLYWRGLREPLHLFPKSSLEFAQYGRAERQRSARDGASPMGELARVVGT